MRTIFRALRYFRQDRLLLFIWLTAILLQIGLGLMQAWPTAILVDSVLGASPHKDDFIHRLFLAALPPHVMAQVIGLSLMALFMKVGQEGLGWVRRIANRRLELNGTFRARLDLHNKLQQLGPAYQKTQRQGDPIYRVSFDVAGFPIIMNVLCDADFACVTLLLMGFLMWTRSSVLTIIAMSVVPSLLYLNFRFASKIKRRTIRAKEADTLMTNSLIRSITGIFVVQAFCRQLFEFTRFRQAASQAADRWQDVQYAESTYNFWMQNIFGLAGFMITVYGGYLIYQEQIVDPVPNGFSIGDLMVFLAYLGSLWDPLSRLTGVDVLLKPGIAGVERVFQILDRPPLIVEKPNAATLKAKPRRITLDHVAFTHPGGTQVLRDVSATIEPGQFVAFVGPSGTGKSTLLSLLARFYDPDSGTVAFDGHNLRHVAFDDVRSHIAMASQDAVMLPASVRENIAYGNPSATDEEVKTAAKLAGADDFIEQMDGRYDAIISENGQNLSGGQRQRIALARALLSPAPILVLDEPTSALDAQHEQIVISTLERERAMRTIILVTHKMSTVAKCDKIFVLDQGRVQESGTHEELLNKRGLYVQLQQEPAPASLQEQAPATLQERASVIPGAAEATHP